VPEPAAQPPSPFTSLFLLGGIAQVAMILPVFAAPFVAKEFGLSDRDLALVSGVIALGAFGAFALARLADRHGRRPVLRAGFAALAPLALVTAFAPGVVLYVAAQLISCGLRGALGSVVSVAITEVSGDDVRPRNHARFGAVAAIASGLPLGLAAVLGERPDGWRWLFAITGASVLLLPWIWRRVPETGRFERLRDGPASERARVRELLAPAYRRRAVGLVAVGVMRGAAIGAVGFYAFHHAVANVGLPSAQAAGVFAGAGTLGIFGNRAGAVLSERWGRRPTQVAGALLTVASGVAYYWVPAGLGLTTPLLLGVAFFGYVFGVQAFGVADRLVDTELFPTRLRATYAGVRMIGDAAAQTLQNFGLAAAIALLGNLERALAVFVPLLVVPALALFWWVTTESRGLSLDEAALEKPIDTAAPL
jgi:predicted MFS family arabinose efflux permease